MKPSWDDYDTMSEPKGSWVRVTQDKLFSPEFLFLESSTFSFSLPTSQLQQLGQPELERHRYRLLVLVYS